MGLNVSVTHLTIVVRPTDPRRATLCQSRGISRHVPPQGQPQSPPVGDGRATTAS